MINKIKLDDGINERGFFSVVLQLISIKVRYPNVPFFIDLTNWSIYQNNKNDNVWEYYFEQFYDNFETDLKIDNQGSFVNYQERFISLPKIRKGIKDLKIKSHILDKISQFDGFYENKKVLGIHKRGTDSDEHRKSLTIDEYFEKVDKVVNNYDLIYICSDEQHSVDKFKEKYKDKIFCYDESFRSRDKKPIHKPGCYPECNNYKKGEDVLIDAILLSKCNQLMISDSNVAFFSIYNNNNKFTFVDNTVVR